MKEGLEGMRKGKGEGLLLCFDESGGDLMVCFWEKVILVP